MSDGNELEEIRAQQERLGLLRAKRRKKPQQNEFSKALSFFLQISVTIIACLVVGIFLGYFLDRWLNTSPWMILVFTFLGVAAAFKSIFDFAKKVK